MQISSKLINQKEKKFVTYSLSKDLDLVQLVEYTVMQSRISDRLI
jgi:hypothetical protein